MSNNASPFLWVKLGNCRSIEISTESCRNVHELIKKVKAEASSLAGVSIERINLYTGDPVRNEALRPGLLLTEISSQTGYSRNDDAHPLFVAVASSSPFSLFSFVWPSLRFQSVSTGPVKHPVKLLQREKLVKEEISNLSKAGDGLEKITPLFSENTLGVSLRRPFRPQKD